MKIHLLSGFLGSGKTTAIQSACRILLDKGIRTAVITNDQGIRLVDADLFKHLGIPGRQVMNGCFCCNYQDLDRQIQSLEDSIAPEVIFAESVGSCTDIIATVLKPLRLFRQDEKVTLSVFADALLLHMLLVDGNELFDESVSYIYFKQLEESTLLVINKTDLLNPDQFLKLSRILSDKFPDKILHYQKSMDNDQVAQWIAILDRSACVAIPGSLEMDYQVYGEGEAKLAWLDQEIVIESADETADRGAVRLMQDIHERVVASHFPIGHLKFLLNGDEKFSFTSTSGSEMNLKTVPALSATLLLNARVQTEPEILSLLVSDSLNELEKQGEFKVRVRTHSAFQPGFPRPTHRIE
ncbi:MAG: GTP-binding protein [Chitinophagales bacterium]